MKFSLSVTSMALCVKVIRVLPKHLIFPAQAYQYISFRIDRGLINICYEQNLKLLKTWKKLILQSKQNAVKPNNTSYVATHSRYFWYL